MVHYWKDGSDDEDEVRVKVQSREATHIQEETFQNTDALQSSPKRRLDNLAKHKVVHEKHLHERNCIWKVNRMTLNANPTKRVQELALPRYIVRKR